MISALLEIKDSLNSITILWYYLVAIGLLSSTYYLFFFFFLEENSNLFHYVLVTLKGWVSQSLVPSTFYPLLSPVSANPNSDTHLISVLHHLGKALVDVFCVPPSLAVHSLFLSLWNPYLILRCGVDCGAYSTCLECLFPRFSYFLCVGSVWLQLVSRFSCIVFGVFVDWFIFQRLTLFYGNLGGQEVGEFQVM